MFCLFMCIYIYIYVFQRVERLPHGKPSPPAPHLRDPSSGDAWVLAPPEREPVGTERGPPGKQCDGVGTDPIRTWGWLVMAVEMNWVRSDAELWA